MTDAFAREVHAVLRGAREILEMGVEEPGQRRDVESRVAELAALLTPFDRPDSPNHRLAGYALRHWIDELARAALGRSVFETEDDGQFFVKAEEAIGLPESDAGEVFFLCVALGYRGAGSAKGSPAPSLDTWSRPYVQRLRKRFGRFEPVVGPVDYDPTREALPLTGRRFERYAYYVSGGILLLGFVAAGSIAFLS